MSRTATDRENDWIYFLEGPPRPKTRTWFVVKKDAPLKLGEIIWFGHWRRYCFFPSKHTVFEENCLRTIASFCEERTSEHREAQKAQAPT